MTAANPITRVRTIGVPVRDPDGNGLEIVQESSPQPGQSHQRSCYGNGCC